ncbi:transketolase family protein [Azospirillum largimobile]
MRGRFKNVVTALAQEDEKVAVILGDVSVYQFIRFKEQFPKRLYNMGICENTLISVAAGLAATGFRPFVHTIAPFLTDRSVEQIKLDMCYNGFGGNIVTCGASFDYAWDGATHHTHIDLATLRMLPDTEVLQPGSEDELESLLRSQYANGKTTYFRLSDYPHTLKTETAFGKGTVVKDVGAGVTVMTAGPLLPNVLEAVRDLPVNLAYFHTIKPIDRAVVERFRHTRILVVHDAFGLREAINEVPGLWTAYHGLPDIFCGWYGTVHDIRAKLALDPPGIRQAVEGMMAGLPS